MNRKQLYNEIVALGLQNAVKDAFGKNYTNCSNEELESMVQEAHKVIGVAQKNTNSFIALVDILAKKKILLKSEVAEIINA